MIADARKDGFLLDKEERNPKRSRYYLSRAVHVHCLQFFRDRMDFTKIERADA